MSSIAYKFKNKFVIWHIVCLKFNILWASITRIEALFLLVALQKTPSLLGAECQGVGTTPLHANERGQTVRFVAVIEPPVYWGISI